jgi:hypothetical protein
MINHNNSHSQLQRVRVHRREVLRRRPQPLQRRQQRQDAQARDAGGGAVVAEVVAQLGDCGCCVRGRRVLLSV